MAITKNIHTKITTHPSHLYYDCKIEKFVVTSDLHSDQPGELNYSIHITSNDDELIGLDAGWNINYAGVLHKEITPTENFWKYREKCKPIIMTTDPYLISQGIQEIPFIFIKNWAEGLKEDLIEVKKINGRYHLIY
jgi:hypothetical protein